MANELMTVEFESLSGIMVKLDAATVRDTLTRGNGKVSDQEVAMFLRTCQAKKLDPLETGEVYLIKYDDKSPANMVVGYFAYIRRADKFPDYRGFKAGITVIRKGSQEPIQKEGQCVYKALGEQLIGGWCRVYRERAAGYVEETFVEVSLEEYSTGKSNWNAKPATMIRKVAIAQAFRAAFPNEYEGLYTIDEMQASGAIPGRYQVVEETGEVIDMGEAEEGEGDDRIITQDERQILIDLAQSNFGKKDGNEILISLIKGMGYESSYEIKKHDYDEIMRTLMDIIKEKGRADLTSSKDGGREDEPPAPED